MAKIAKGNGTNDYTQQVLGNDSELVNSDNDEDITGGVVEGEDGQAGSQSYSEDDDDEQLEDEDDGEQELEDEEEQPVVKQTQTQKKGQADDVRYGKEQVQKIVQTRVGTYTKRLEKLQPYKEAMDRISDITGLDVTQLLGRLNGMSIDEQAKILGMTPDQVRNAKAARTQLQQEQGKVASLSREVEITKLMTDKNYSDFDLYKEEINDLLDDNPKLTVKQAYILARGDNAVTTAVRDTEQRVVNRQVIQRQKGIVKPVGGAKVSNGPKISSDIVSAAKRVGMDPVEYAKYQGIDNIDAYRAMKAKNKK